MLYLLPLYHIYQKVWHLFPRHKEPSLLEKKIKDKHWEKHLSLCEQLLSSHRAK